MARVDQVQAFGDLALGRRIGGGGQRHARDVRPAFVQHRELAVFGTEIVAPLRDAMRLVDGEQRDAAAFQQGQEARVQQALRGDVKQVQIARQQGAFDPLCVLRVQRGIEEFGAHAELAQRLDLVLHQRDQRRDHNADAVAQQRRHLIAQRLAATGGHQHQGIVTRSDVFDNGLLWAAEVVVTEDAAEQFVGGGIHPLRIPRGSSPGRCQADAVARWRVGDCRDVVGAPTSADADVAEYAACGMENGRWPSVA